jgi:4-amino-4-deoxy-L-arabinose transferase-like glycosyltransferase
MLEKKRLLNTLSRIDRNLAIGLAITLFGFLLRFHRYDSLPPFNWTQDEFAFAWSGMSLLQDGVPTSWSFLSPTDDFLVAVWEKTAVRFRFVTPWFDHPPLFGLIVGATAILGGAREFFDCTLSVIRIPSLVFGTLSIFLLYWLALRLTNTTIAAIASLIFATNPNTVFLSRLTVSENFISCISLGVILLFLQYRETGRNKYLNLAIILGSMAILAKVTGIYIIASIAAFLLFEKKWKYSLIAIGGALTAFALYYLYGAFYDFQWFLTTLQEHKNRFSDFAMLGYLILPKVFFEDGWLTFSWLTLLLVARSNLKQFTVQTIIFPILIYTVLLIFSGAQSHYYAWYTIPYYPFLFIILAIFFDNFRKEPDFITACTIFIFLVVWSVNLNLKEAIFSSPYGRQYFIVSTSILLGVFFFQDVTDKKISLLVQFTKIIPMIFFIGLLVGNCNLILNYNP